ncbi:hypothetical protein CLV80_11740 [Yoonia maritima]|uniref:Uncharacterized protein n=1 Tax=Yoonia maritima TaxID=1435347 RepID=A0A2T0VTP1_9RHOB|nr:hypothetical protein [Yoonia maritima]PRY74522.1 hypothetical protein CLV80_11740 [Yoonia maritima]
MPQEVRLAGKKLFLSPLLTGSIIFASQISQVLADETTLIASRTLDLDGDGLAEIIELRGYDELRLDIRSSDGSKILASGGVVGWLNEPSDQPQLEMNDVGSLTVTSEHLNGPSKYRVNLVVAHRAEAYRVVGLTYDQWGLDFDDPETGEMFGQSCEMNLLTGNGHTTFPDFGDLQVRSIDFPVPTLEDWRWEMLEDICGEGAE